MVKQIFCGTVLLLITISVEGCSVVKQFWGEAPPQRQTVQIKGDPLPAFEKIFSANENEASQTLDAWRVSVRSSFSQIHGAHTDFLTLDEVAVLVRKGFLKLADDPEVSVERARSALTLIGFKNGVSASSIESLFEWIKINRLQLSSFYSLFIASAPTGETGWTSGDLLSVLQLFGSFAELGGAEPLSQKEMVTLIQPWIPAHFVHAKAGVANGVDLAVSFFSSLCGDRVDPNLWNGKKIGVCIHDLTDHFKSSSPVFDFIFSQMNPITSRSSLKAASADFTHQISSWMEGHHHPPFMTEKVSQLADALSIPPPYAFFRLTEWLPKLNADSTPEKFSPSFFNDLALLVQTWTNSFLTVTADQKTDEKCVLTDWRLCEFTGTFEPADQLFSAEYATLIRSKNLNYIYKIALYDSVSGFLMQKLDLEKDSVHIKDLINVTIRLLDSNAFAYNVVNRILENPIDPSSAEDSTKNIHREGLAELAALGADIIPSRGKDQNFLKRIKDQLYDGDKHIPYTLDRVGITAFIYVYDLLTSLRQDYLDHYDLPIKVEGPNSYVKRRKIVEALPRMLFDHFPRIYNECLDWGFERTCGVVFTEVLPSADPGRDDLQTYELDLMNLSAILLESMTNRCDRNNDDLFNYGEKDCVISIAQALVNRLMKANIITPDPSTQRLLGLINNVAIARWAGQTILTEGTTKAKWYRLIPPFSLFSGPASEGSVLSLAAQLMDSDKVKAIEAGVMGHHEDAGDELIYLNQLTEHYLPLNGRAKRTSLIGQEIEKEIQQELNGIL